jgi:hypothetical protein
MASTGTVDIGGRHSVDIGIETSIANLRRVDLISPAHLALNYAVTCIISLDFKPFTRDITRYQLLSKLVA